MFVGRRGVSRVSEGPGRSRSVPVGCSDWRSTRQIKGLNRILVPGLLGHKTLVCWALVAWGPQRKARWLGRSGAQTRQARAHLSQGTLDRPSRLRE